MVMNLAREEPFACCQSKANKQIGKQKIIPLCPLGGLQERLAPLAMLAEGWNVLPCIPHRWPGPQPPQQSRKYHTLSRATCDLIGTEANFKK